VNEASPSSFEGVESDVGSPDDSTVGTGVEAVVDERVLALLGRISAELTTGSTGVGSRASKVTTEETDYAVGAGTAVSHLNVLELSS
jgi:hypothetical protein